VATSLTHGRALRYAKGSARGLLHHLPGHCLQTALTLKRVNREVKRRADVIGISPDDQAIV
jgi:transposase-like protein